MAELRDPTVSMGTLATAALCCNYTSAWPDWRPRRAMTWLSAWMSVDCRSASAAPAHDLGSRTAKSLRLKSTTVEVYASAFEHELMEEARRLLAK